MPSHPQTGANTNGQAVGPVTQVCEIGSKRNPLGHLQLSPQAPLVKVLIPLL